MGQALYRTHRPLKLSEVVGQEHVTTALEHALKAGTISHAYLFTGPRGVGKTSIARILAHEINHLPYTDDSIHLDIIEIDAASNRRIDEIRDLRDKVHIAPTSAKYKVYIIDEVHMLTREAFNALLKTLEEPPAHAVFILATTEMHKLPETIVSRTQRYAFKPVDSTKVIEHLQHIAKQEKIDIDPEALALVAEHGEGSFRDSISLLDQVRNRGGGVRLKDVQLMLGIAPIELVNQLSAALSNHNAASVVNTLRQAKEQGFEAVHLAKQLAGVIRADILDKQSELAHDVAMQLLEKLLGVPGSSDPQAYLEIILLEAALSGQQALVVSKQPTPQPETAVKKPVKKVAQTATPAPTVKESVAKKPSPKTEPAVETESESIAATPGGAVLGTAIWPQVLATIKQNFNTLYSILRTADAAFEPGLIRLSFAHAFHQKRARDAKNREIIANTILELTGQNVQIECVVAEKSEAKKTSEAVTAAVDPSVSQAVSKVSGEPKQAIEAISNIFGKAEVLES